MASYLGLMVAVGAFGYAVVIALDKLVYGNEVPGYPSVMVVILFQVNRWIGKSEGNFLRLCDIFFDFS